MNPIFSLIAGAISPIVNLIDKMHTSDEERLNAKAAIFEMQAGLLSQLFDYERQLMESKTSIIVAEAQGGSWLQRSWRPITMLTFLALVVCDSFGILAFRLAEQAWALLQIGLGGYVVGRSAEKIAPKILDVLRKDP